MTKEFTEEGLEIARIISVRTVDPKTYQPIPGSGMMTHLVYCPSCRGSTSGEAYYCRWCGKQIRKRIIDPDEDDPNRDLPCDTFGDSGGEV